MTTPRCCPDCGLEEHRKLDERGREVVNLSPMTNQCVTCLGKAALAKHIFRSRLITNAGEQRDIRIACRERFDPRAAAARNDE